MQVTQPEFRASGPLHSGQTRSWAVETDSARAGRAASGGMGHLVLRCFFGAPPLYGLRFRLSTSIAAGRLVVVPLGPGWLERRGEILLVGWADQEIEREKEGLREGEEGYREQQHQDGDLPLQGVPRRVGPGRDEEDEKPEGEDRLHRHEVEEVGPEPVASLAPLEAEPANGAVGAHLRPREKDRPAAAVRAAKPGGSD